MPCKLHLPGNPTILLTLPSSVCITSVIRLKSLYEISVSTDVSCKALPLHRVRRTNHGIVDGVNAGIWSGIEINVGIACASLPALKPLISKMLPGFLTNLTSRTRGSNGSVDEISHKMSTVKSVTNPSKRQTQVEEIKVVQSIYQQTDAVPSMEGSERSLVNWKTNCYSGQHEIRKANVNI